jgi:hypothetical protein
MQHRMIRFGVMGLAAAGLCAGLATTALASSGHSAAAQSAEHSPAAGYKPAQSKAQAETASDDLNPTQIATLLREVQQGQAAWKDSTGGPSSTLVAEERQLLDAYKAQGKATAAQLAWLALSPAQQNAQAAPWWSTN